MIKRNSRNIGKEIRILRNKDFEGRSGKVVGFRGDMEKGNPWVEVYLYSTKSVWPFPGSSLEPREAGVQGVPGPRVLKPLVNR